jgi:LCP family protein required for cell wall assembly
MGHAATAPATSRHGAGARPGRVRLVTFTGCLIVLATLSAYLVVVIAIRLDRLILPGNELTLPPVFAVVPGLAAAVPPAETGADPRGPRYRTVASTADRITVLLLGLDRRPSEGTEPTRSDTMLLLTLDPVTKTAGVLSIPRDLWVAIPDGQGGFFEDRINTAYRYGGLSHYPGGAMQAARDTIAHTFPSIHIDYVAVLDMAAFVRVIDTLGGVDLPIPQGFRYHERVSLDDRDGVLPAFQAGLEHMTGARALYYVRYREDAEGDLGRIRRQQQVLLAVAGQLLRADALAHAPQLWGQLRDAIETDLPTYRIPGLALLATQVELDRVVLRSVGEVTREVVTAAGAEVLVADPADVARVVNAIFADPRLRREGATVEIRAGTGRPGLAAEVAAAFIQGGLDPLAVSLATASAAGAEQTTILDYGGKRATAAQLAVWLGLPAVRVRAMRATGPTWEGPDIVVVLGRDATVPGRPRVRGPGR